MASSGAEKEMEQEKAGVKRDSSKDRLLQASPVVKEDGSGMPQEPDKTEEDLAIEEVAKPEEPPKTDAEETAKTDEPATNEAASNSADSDSEAETTETVKPSKKKRSFTVIRFFLYALLADYLLLQWPPAVELGTYVVSSSANCLRSTGCVMYEMLYRPVCELEKPPNYLDHSAGPEYRDFFLPKSSLSPPTCPAACGKQLITRLCSTDEKIVFPSIFTITRLYVIMNVKGAAAVGGWLKSGVMLIMRQALHILSLSIALVVVILFALLFLGKIADILMDRYNFRLSGTDTLSRLKGKKTTPKAKKINTKASGSLKTPGKWGPFSEFYSSVSSKYYEALGEIQEGCFKDDLTVGKEKMPKNTVTLADYKGATEAKKELELVVGFLKDPKVFHDLGARLPRGILLYGPPGTGKTLFARALAGEANVQFIHKCASEFRGSLVGSGARSIRNLFADARRVAPCIVFIDELDSISKRTSSELHPYANQAINQLLFEMDGFIQNSADVVIVGATNRLDNIDSALLRPGRFDTIVQVQLPDQNARYEILQHYVSQLNKSGELDVALIANKTEEYSGAELEHLVNQAALLAATEAADKVEQKHLEAAIKKRKKTLQQMKEYDATSYKPSSRANIAHMYN